MSTPIRNSARALSLRADGRPLAVPAVVVGLWLLVSVLGLVLESRVLTALAPFLLLGLPVWFSRRRAAAADPLEPLWPFLMLFGFTYLVVPALALARPTGYASLIGYLDAPPSQWQAATWIAGLGLLAATAGYFSPLASALARRLPNAPAVPTSRRHLTVSVALLLVGGAAAIQLFRVSGGGSLTIAQLLRGGLRDASVRQFSGQGYLSLGLSLLALSVPCAALWAADAKRIWAWLLVAVGGLVITTILGLVFGSRFLGLLVVVSTALVVHYRVRRISVPVALGLVALIVVAMVAFVVHRNAVCSGSACGSSSRGFPNLLDAPGVLVGTFDGFDHLTNALGRVHSFMWGSSFFQDVFYTYIPRFLWHGKPVIYGAVAAQERVVPGLNASVMGSSTYPPGLLGEGYVNFGVAGALLWPFAAGILLRAVYLRLIDGFHSFYLVLAGWMLAVQVSIMRGLGLVLPGLVLTAVILLPLALPIPTRLGRVPRRSPA